MLKEEKIATYTAKNLRIQLLKITEVKPNDLICLGGKYYINNKEVKYAEVSKYYTPKYQVRQNRKIIYTSCVKYISEKKFASIVTSEILQQKFNF